MENDQSNTLLQKTKSAHFDASSYSQLEAFASRLASEFVVKAGEQIGAEIEVSAVQFTALSGQQSLADKDGSCALFASQTANKAGSVLVSVSANVAGAFAEAMFGGEFALGDGDSGPTDIDVALLAMTLNKVLTQIGGNNIVGEIPSRQPDAMRVSPVSYSSEEVARFDNVTLCNIALDLAIGTAQAENAITFHFPMDYLDAHGLLEKSRKHEVGDEEQSRWRHEMNANVENSEIQLDIVLGSFNAQLSQLTDLSVGELIPVPVSADTASKVILNTVEGSRVIGNGRLGAYKGNKAIKLLGSLEP